MPTTALPTVTGPDAMTYNARGTVASQTGGLDQSMTTQRLEQEQMLHAIFKDLRFYEEQWMETVDIPEKMNELVYWEIEVRQPGNAVFEIDEQGLTKAGFDSTGAAIAAGQEVKGMVIGQDSVQASPHYTVVGESVSKRDPVVRGENEMGKVIAEQLDQLVRGAFDAYAQDIYPRAAVTSDAQIAANDYLTYEFLIKLEVYVLSEGFNPPGSSQRYPAVMSLDGQAGLLLDATTKSILENTSARGAPMASVFETGYLGSLRCFDFYTSNRIKATVGGVGGTVNFGRGYVFTAESIASLAMESDEYGQRAKPSNSPGQGANGRAWRDEMPRPVKVMRHEPGSGALGRDPFMNRAAIAEVHTLGIFCLRKGFLIRFMYAVSPASRSNLGIKAEAAGKPGTGDSTHNATFAGFTS